ncbi:hypothetical protein T459_18152 [Capsicum annuum]|uniref:Cupin type-1 domain-containing protein n=1 Tax=Capsicum annuum TaxID=4072 RepID=A0A2G2ZDN1_CAPAN|nr:hypothetical protein T459_18152 [Capsicum annuum]
MGNRRTLLFLVLVLFSALVASVCAYEYEEKESKQRTQGEKWFLLRQLHNVVKTDAGSMRMVKGVHIYIVQCILVSSPWNLIVSSSLREARVGHIYRDELAERHLKHGDVYTIPAGSAFYLENRAENERLCIICSIDITSESMGWHAFQSFFIGGGVHPVSVLAGFDHNTLSTALNVSTAELRTFLTRQSSGPIVHLSGSHDTNTWSKFLNLESHQKLAHLKRIVNFQDEASPKEEESTWSLRKILFTLLNREDVVHIAYNLYNRKPDFRNDYGWIKKLDEFDYSPLRQSGNVVYLGSMMAPHVNPTAIEYGIVLKGTGRIQIVYPNGTLAMNAGVREGDVFWVPRYFPFCQTASTNGPFQIAGFTTSARRNHPQFLVGRNSLMQSLRGPEFAAAFGIGEKRLKRITNAQHELVILPSSSAAPADLV